MFKQHDNSENISHVELFHSLIEEAREVIKLILSIPKDFCITDETENPEKHHFRTGNIKRKSK